MLHGRSPRGAVAQRARVRAQARARRRLAAEHPREYRLALSHLYVGPRSREAYRKARDAAQRALVKAMPDAYREIYTVEWAKELPLDLGDKPGGRAGRTVDPWGLPVLTGHLADRAGWFSLDEPNGERWARLRGGGSEYLDPAT